MTKYLQSTSCLPSPVGEFRPSSNASVKLARAIRPAISASIAALIASSVPAIPATGSPAISASNPEPRAIVSAGGTATNDASALSLQLAYFLRPNERSLVAAQVYGAKGDSDFGIISGGIAVRHLIGDSKTFVGANVFFDALRDSDGFSYSQVGFGAEVSRGRFTLRGNYYLPVGSRGETTTSSRERVERKVVNGVDSSGRTFSAVGRSSFTETFEVQRDAMQGWDVELEMAIFEQPRFFDPVVAVGYYRIWDGGADYSGLRARGAVNIGEHVTVGVEWREDAGDIGQEWRADVAFHFPIGAEPSSVDSGAVRVPVRSDGKTEVAMESRDGKAVRPPDGGGKGVIPVEPTPPTGPEYPRGFIAPVQRTPWPNVIVRSSSRSSNSKLSRPVILFGPAVPPDDCGCDSGPVIIFP